MAPIFRLDTLPSLAGRIAIVTGATSGIGLYAALGLAHLGAHVIVSGRRRAQGEAAIARIAAAGGSAVFEPLDLASQASVAAFAAKVADAHPRIDILVNNAGVLAVPHWTPTVDGFETQFATNYLGHFALTCRLLPSLRGGRVVSISSISHHRVNIIRDDIQSRRDYTPWTAYARSKLAMLMFALELQRRSEHFGWGVTSVAAHPGVAATEIAESGPLIGLSGGSLWQRIMSIGLRLVGQPAERGAEPTVLAAAVPDLPGGSYLGPGGFREYRGRTVLAMIAPQARDLTVAEDLWRQSEALTGVTWAG